VKPLDFSQPFERLCISESFATRGRTVTEADVVGFSALTGDWHPQHSDAQWAASSQFGERIAHGMLIVSLAVGLVPFDPDRVVALRRITDTVFKRPVRFGDTISVAGTIAALRDIDDATGLVTWSWKVLNQDGETACRARVDVLWRRDHPALPEPFAPAADGFVPIPL
jgi:acyl dehydratase